MIIIYNSLRWCVFPSLDVIREYAKCQVNKGIPSIFQQVIFPPRDNYNLADHLW